MLTDIDHIELLAKANRPASRSPRPFLRWAGSKRGLLSQIVPLLPAAYSRYYEPFLGGGSLATLLQPASASLSDVSEDLINCWQQVRDVPDAIIECLDSWALDKDTYYRLRSTVFDSRVERAAQFIFLNRGAFNGLYRVNRKGQFNVPWGAPKSANIIDKKVICDVAHWLRGSGVTIRHSDFAASLSHARSNDLVFLDPPYHAVTTAGRDFRHYNENLFSWTDQRRLARMAEGARMRGAFVVVTNSYSRDISDLYPNFESRRLLRRSSIAADSRRRDAVSEFAFIGRPNSP
ncbi:Dam family site-specific DNA-(adenine-N6)-methyltransferase [Frigoribacterium sp. Leaf8]|uniref:DNA adenine methylase n=1 Tax=Frigoribacterium sp. Leaf8 TaxID=1735673 RepID=UPI0009EC06E7